MEQNQVPQTPRPFALLLLLSVPVVWGTYAPVVRGLQTIDPPLPGFVFSTASFAVAALSTWFLEAFQRHKEPVSKETTKANVRTTALAGIELGSWIFLGTTLQIVGLRTVPSDRAGFLIQLTTLLVPLIQAATEGDFFSVPLRTWTACWLALAGIVTMGLAPGTSLAAASPGVFLSSLTQGDLLILLAAFMYSMHVVRLGRWASRVPPLALVTAKSTWETVLSAAFTVGMVVFAQTGGAMDTSNAVVSFFLNSGREVAAFFGTLSERFVAGTLSSASLQLAAGAVLWSGWISTAFVNYAQSYGQRAIKPSEANLIYSSQPLFTAVFAYFLLGESNMESNGLIGAGLLGSAIYLVASKPSEEEDKTASTS